ncbi:MAG: hypothetical protein QXV17_06765 [Candidatus Micrarchaeaceae archaeon]
MPNPNYVKGANFERKLIGEAYARGAKYAARIAGSHTPIDLIVVFGSRVYLIQAKKRHLSENESLKQLDIITKLVKPDYYYTSGLILTGDNWRQILDKEMGIKRRKYGIEKKDYRDEAKS